MNLKHTALFRFDQSLNGNQMINGHFSMLDRLSESRDLSKTTHKS